MPIIITGLYNYDLDFNDVLVSRDLGSSAVDSTLHETAGTNTEPQRAVMTAATYSHRFVFCARTTSRFRISGAGWARSMRGKRRRLDEVAEHCQAACEPGACAIQRMAARVALAGRPGRVPRHKDMSLKTSIAAQSDHPLAVLGAARHRGVGDRRPWRDSP